MSPVPSVEKKPKELKIHGDLRVDNYYWLNERENPDVIKYIEEENAYTKEQLKHTEKFQSDLFEEMKSRIKEDDESIPYKKNGYYYQTKYKIGEEYPRYYRRKESLDAEEIEFFNVNELASGKSYYQMGGISISPDNKIAAFGEDTLGRRIYTLKFKNLESGEIWSETIENTGGSCVWSNDNKYIFYTQKDSETLRYFKIFRHKIGTSSKDDVLIYHEEDDTFNAFVYKTKSKKYIIIGSSHSLMNEYRILEADNPLGEFRIFHPRENNLEYSFTHYQDKFYIHTNMEGAKNFKIMYCDENNTAKENWKEFIPHRKEVLLQGMNIFKDYFVLEERENGLNKIRVISWDNKSDYYLNFDEDTYSAGVGTNPDYDTEILQYAYTSLTSPTRVYEFNMTSKEEKLIKEQEVLGDFDRHLYEAKRVWAKGKDGAKIAISLVYKKGIKLDGNNPTLLYGYGSYGHIVDPGFSSIRLSLLNRGFVYAIAHVRGGEYLGREWYDSGKMLKKRNTFDDFIACTEHLIEEKYSKAEKMYAMGGSAGGLLVGAVINQRPDLYNGVVAAVPFVDVVTTMLDDSIPLTTGEYDEWGNPNNEQYYHYMKSYSPYDNVEEKKYPNLLVTAGLHDSQVQYWEAAKWVAKLRDYKTDTNKLLLHTNMDAGHGGASGRFESLKEVAMEYAFIFDLESIEK